MFLARCRATSSSSSIIISSSVASRSTVTVFSASYTASESSPTVLQKKLSPLLLLRATRPLFADQLLKELHFQCATVFCIAPISLHWRRCDTHIIGLPKNAQTPTGGVLRIRWIAGDSRAIQWILRHHEREPDRQHFAGSPRASRRLGSQCRGYWEFLISQAPCPSFPSLQCNQRCLSVSKRRLPKIPGRFCTMRFRSEQARLTACKSTASVSDVSRASTLKNQAKKNYN